MANIKLSDLANNPDTVLESIAIGDYVLVHDVSEQIDTKKIKVIKYSDLVNLVSQCAVQALVSGQAAGDLFYAEGESSLAKLAKGAAGQILRMNSGATLPEWGEASEELTSCRVRRSSNQSISNNTYSVIYFTSEDWDDNDFHSNSSSPSRITIPEDGKYMFGTSIFWASRAAGMRRMWIGLGVDSSFLCGASDIFDAGSGTCMLSCSGIYSFEAGDYIRVIVWQNSGSSLDIEAQDAMPNFWIMKIG